MRLLKTILAFISIIILLIVLIWAIANYPAEIVGTFVTACLLIIVVGVLGSLFAYLYKFFK